MSNTQPGFWMLTIKTIVVHTVTYFLVGLVAFTVLNYAETSASSPPLARRRPSWRG